MSVGDEGGEVVDVVVLVVAVAATVGPSLSLCMLVVGVRLGLL